MSHELTLTGTRPILMHSVQNLGDPDSDYVKAIDRLNALKSKITDEQRAERDWLKFRGGLYYDDTDGPILPAANVFKSLREGAALSRNGKDVERGLVFLDVHAPLEYEGPRDPKLLYEDGRTRWVDRRIGRINRAPVVTIRPRFDQWSATFEFDIDEEVLDLDDLVHIAKRAGRLIHIGDYRPFFGFYTVAVS